jgi:DNA-binding transcriptional LysR family regulator
MTDLEIRYFLEIVNQGVSFTRASQTLYVSQPALTKHVNTLGEELGVKLFDTTRKNAIHLTPAGKLYYQFFMECRDKFNKTRDEARTLAHQGYGEIRIVSLAGWDMLSLLPLKKEFCKTHPNVTLSIVSAGFRAIKYGILNNQYDLAITIPDQFRGLPNIYIRDHYRIPAILLFSSQHRLAGKEDLSIVDFKDDVFYNLPEEEIPFIKQVNKTYFSSKGFMPRFKTLPNLDSILLTLQTGSGCAIGDIWMRDKDNPNFKYKQLDLFLYISDVWKADNTNKALDLFLKTYVHNQPLLEG